MSNSFFFLCFHCVFVFIAVDDTNMVAPTINKPTVEYDGECRCKCTDSATDDSSCDSNTQSSYATFATNDSNPSDIHIDPTEMW